MDPEKITLLRQLIELHDDIVDFGAYGEGVSAVWIEKAEASLGRPLPDSYKWWAGNYGGGEIAGEEIYSIYEAPDGAVGGDIVYMDRIYRTKTTLGPTCLPICNSDIDGLFYFDYSAVRANGECPVVADGTGRVYAEDFIDFLIKRIRACTEQ